MGIGVRCVCLLIEYEFDVEWWCCVYEVDVFDVCGWGICVGKVVDCLVVLMDLFDVCVVGWVVYGFCWCCGGNGW